MCKLQTVNKHNETAFRKKKKEEHDALMCPVLCSIHYEVICVDNHRNSTYPKCRRSARSKPASPKGEIEKAHFRKGSSPQESDF